jgi:3-oxoacyl-(acyl-carrier-protein) synthase
MILTKMADSKKCPTTQSDLTANGFHQATLNDKREMAFDRFGVSTPSRDKITACTTSQHNITSAMCKMKTPGHVLAFDATWDRSALVSNCGSS